MPLGSHSSKCKSMKRVPRSEEHTSELQSQSNLVCRLLLEKKKTNVHNLARSQTYIPTRRILTFRAFTMSLCTTFVLPSRNVAICTLLTCIRDTFVCTYSAS